MSTDTYGSADIVPPEVSLDRCGRQLLAPGYPRAIPCEGGCGYLIGCGDAIGTLWHQSCWDRAQYDGFADHSEPETTNNG